MGIQGLIPFLKRSSKQTNIKEFSGCTAAVDAYCWLHKGAFSCAEKLAKGEKTDGYVHYCMKLVNSLLSMNVTPILVFDGCNLPAKKDVETNRKKAREANRTKGKEFLRQGKLKEARECFQRCVDVTSEMASDVIKACHRKGVDCIVAPYEADAQLAYLNKKGIAQVIITEDSDLILFGCDKIMFKMDIGGNGILVDQSHLHLSMGVTAQNFTFDKFRNMCIMSGCDYLPSLPGIGLNKACKFFKQANNPDLNTVLRKIPTYLSMPNLTVTKEYIQGFICAVNTFLYQIVFDPCQRKQVPLNPYPSDMDHSSLSYAGKYKPDAIAYQMALGNINVNTMEKMNDFDPDKMFTVLKSSSWNDKPSQNVRKSIWDADFKIIEKKKPNPFAVEPKTTKGKEVLINVENFLKRKSNSGETSNSSTVMEVSEEKLTETSLTYPPAKKIKAAENLTSEEVLSYLKKDIKEDCTDQIKKKCNFVNHSHKQTNSVEIVKSRFFPNSQLDEPSKKQAFSWFDTIALEYKNSTSLCSTRESNKACAEKEETANDENYKRIETENDDLQIELHSSDSQQTGLSLKNNFKWKTLKTYSFKKQKSFTHSVNYQQINSVTYDESVCDNKLVQAVEKDAQTQQIESNLIQQSSLQNDTEVKNNLNRTSDTKKITHAEEVTCDDRNSQSDFSSQSDIVGSVTSLRETYPKEDEFLTDKSETRVITSFQMTGFGYHSKKTDQLTTKPCRQIGLSRNQKIKKNSCDFRQQSLLTTLKSFQFTKKHGQELKAKE